MKNYIEEILKPVEYELRRICLTTQIEIKPRDKFIDTFNSVESAFDMAQKLCVKQFSELTSTSLSMKDVEIEPTEFGYDIQNTKTKQKIISFKIYEIFLEEIEC